MNSPNDRCVFSMFFSNTDQTLAEILNLPELGQICYVFVYDCQNIEFVGKNQLS